MLFLLTLFYFILGFVNIYFAYLAFLCMTIPFIVLVIKKKNLWCKGLCPRKSYLNLFRNINLGLKAPKWLYSKQTISNVLTYFCINIFFIVFSTIMVSNGRIAPIEKIRLFIVFQLPWDIPQLIQFSFQSETLTHLAFRLYSIMLSSTLLGTIVAVLFKPSNWCVICPVKTLSNRYLFKSS